MVSDQGARGAWVPLLIVTALGTSAVTAGVLSRAPVAAPPRVVTVRATPDVLVAVRGLSRLESVSFHMERVIDLRETQNRLGGLVQAEDALLLVAAADVVAGVDLGALGPGDVQVEPERSRVRLTLPRATVLSTRLDNRRTFVHSRSTDLLARREEQLEARARQEAERSLEAGALEAGILARAEENAARTLTQLVQALGFREVEVRWR